MRIDMDTPDLERARGRKRVGRKHNHQPRGRAIQRRINRLRRLAELRAEERRKYSLLVSAYWRGEIEDHPITP